MSSASHTTGHAGPGTVVPGAVLNGHSSRSFSGMMTAAPMRSWSPSSWVTVVIAARAAIVTGE